jgi:uncharacterized protein (TIGR03085 family)
MSYLAADERAALCDLALEAGEDAPTLCAGWDVKDLVVHLLVREGSPAAVGIAVPPLSRVTDMATRRVARTDFETLVERLRKGPPLYSPMAIPRLDRMLNTVEFFVHHEDVRRARPGWRPRALDERTQDTLWRTLRGSGRTSLRKATTGVVAERSDTGQRAELRAGVPQVVVRGLPAELVVFVSGRAEAEVDVRGDEGAVADLLGAQRGF